MKSPWLVFAVALVARVLYLAYSLSLRPSLAIKMSYLGYETGNIARSIASGHGFSSPLGIDTGPTAWITPVYPYLLALVFKLFGGFTVQSEVIIKVINSVVSSFAVFPLYAVGRRLFGEGVGIAAAWYWALNYGALYFAIAWVWDTSFSALAMTLLLWMTYVLDDSSSHRNWAIYGGLWALGALINASLLSVFPGWLGYAAYRARARGASWMRLSALTLAVFAAGISPWMLRNELVFHRVMIRSNFGLEFWLGNNPDVPDSWTWWLHPNENGDEREKLSKMGELAYMEEKRHLAIRFIETHPRDFARFCYHRFMHTWTGTTDPIADIWRYLSLPVKAVIGHSVLYSLLALIGLFFVRRAEPVKSFPLVFMMLVFPMVYYITHTTLRYRHPIDPAMCLLAVCAVALPLRAWMKRSAAEKWRSLPAAGDLTPKA